MESGTITDTGTVAYQWFTTSYTGGVTFDFTPANETISDVVIQVTTGSVTNADSGNPPEMQGCYSPNSGTNWYCSNWTTNVAGTTTYNFTISSSAIRNYVAGTNGNSTDGLGSALTSSDWNTLVSQMGTGATNYVRVHVLTNSDGAATPTFDSVSFTVVKLIVDYRTTMSGTNWQWYQNINGITPTTSLANTNVAATNIHRNDIIRLRMHLASNTAGDLTITDESFKLQYAAMVGADCVGGDEVWIDVGAPTDLTFPWRGYINAGATDGTQIPSILLPTGNSRETYEDSNPSASNPAAINYTQKGEWDWVVQNYLADIYTNYCFQMVAATGVNNVSPYTGSATYVPKLTTANDVTNFKGKINLKGKINIK